MPNPPIDVLTPGQLLLILEKPLEREWRPHGIGMLRTYLDPETRNWRLNIWDRSLLNPNISTIHSHPWPFNSYILCGEMTNTRLVHCREGYGASYNAGSIRCGPGFDASAGNGAILTNERVVNLVRCEAENYRAGDVYAMTSDEIHDTCFTTGTMSLICRGAPDTQDMNADIFWPVGQPWGDATRHVTQEEIVIVTAYALERFKTALGIQ